MISAQVALRGRVGRDPETRSTRDGKMVCSFGLATAERTKDASGQWQDGDPTWWQVTAWDRAAEDVAAVVRKGQTVVVLGRARMRTYQGRDGAERQSLDVVADHVAVDVWTLAYDGANTRGGGRQSAEPYPSARKTATPQAPSAYAPPDDDDIPF